MLWLPTDSAVVEYVAIALLFKVEVPSIVVLSMNCTVPVGVPCPDLGITVAVNVTFWLNSEGLSED